MDLGFAQDLHSWPFGSWLSRCYPESLGKRRMCRLGPSLTSGPCSSSPDSSRPADRGCPWHHRTGTMLRTLDEKPYIHPNGPILAHRLGGSSTRAPHQRQLWWPEVFPLADVRCGGFPLRKFEKFAFSGSYVMHPVAFSRLRWSRSEDLAATHREMAGSAANPNRRDDHGDLASGIRGLYPQIRLGFK